MAYDQNAFARLGLDPESGPGALVAQCGFEPFERDDGLYPATLFDPDLAYNRYLWDQGYEAEHPWADIANAALGPDGDVLSGWHMRNAHLPARVAPEHSETAYMTDRAMAFIEEAGGDPGACTSPTSSRIGPISLRRHGMTFTATWTFPEPIGTRPSGVIPIRSRRPSWTMPRARRFRAMKPATMSCRPIWV
jgi:hypothetical protein